MLEDVQLDQIADPPLREVVRRLMNLVAQLSAENQHLREKVPLKAGAGGGRAQRGAGGGALRRAAR